MASAFALAASSKKTEDASQDVPNSSLPYDPLTPFSLNTAYSRTWKSILRALQHPIYTASSLKTTLISRVPKLQNCVDAYPFTQGQSTISGCTVTIDGIKFDITTQQKDLGDKLSQEVQLDSTEACKIVLQQSRVGVVEIDGLVKAYMEERTALLRIVKSLFRIDVHDSTNVKTRALAKEIVSKIKADKEFTSKLVEGIRKRVGRQLPLNTLTDSPSALLWSRQVYIFQSSC
jgi:hypothetical protein